MMEKFCVLLCATLVSGPACVLSDAENEELGDERASAELDLPSPDEELVAEELDSERLALEDPGPESLAPESFAPEDVRLHTSQHIHFGGTFTEEDHYVTVGGACAPGGTRVDPPTVTHLGHGYCNFHEWITPGNPADCRARIHLHHSALWHYGDCYIDIFEQYDPYSCQGICGGQAPSGCYCDSACRSYDDCCMDYDPVCVVPELYQTGISGNAGTWRDYSLNVPAGRTNLVFRITGGTGDADLYVRYGALPTTNLWDCRPYITGNQETCTIPSPAAGTWYVSVRGFLNYAGVTLTGDQDRQL